MVKNKFPNSTLDPSELPIVGFGDRDRPLRLVRTGFLARLAMPPLNVLTMATTDAVTAVTCVVRVV